MDSLQGQALVASPYLTDPNFMRTVVYLIRHDEDGALGIVLNRPTPATVGNLLTSIYDKDIVCDAPVYYGGPVDGALMLMEGRLVAADEISEISFANDEDRILEILKQEPETRGDFRLFEGYSGWGKQQLESELREGSWMLWDMPHELFFSDADQMWQKAILQIGRDVLESAVQGIKIGEDPSLN